MSRLNIYQTLANNTVILTPTAVDDALTKKCICADRVRLQDKKVRMTYRRKTLSRRWQAGTRDLQDKHRDENYERLR